jgi:hypothetical protein
MKTGKMPSGLAKYWKTHKRKVKHSKEAIKRTYARRKAAIKRAHARREAAIKRAHARRRKRMRNPITVFRLAIQKGTRRESRLFWNGEKFTKNSRPDAFGSLALVKAKGHFLARRWGKQLSGYTFFAVPGHG